MKKKEKKLTAFGKRVKKRLIDLGMTQVELAEALGMNRHYLCRILSGDRSGKTYRHRIIELLGMDEAA